MSLENLFKGVPLGTVTVVIDEYLFTDSSIRGWGAHMGSLQASGLWSRALIYSHINLLELHAVRLGLQAFSSYLEQTNVAIMSDNMSTVAYLRNQGGGHSVTADRRSGITGVPMDGSSTDHFDPQNVPGHLNAHSQSTLRKGQILKTK